MMNLSNIVKALQYAQALVRPTLHTQAVHHDDAASDTVRSMPEQEEQGGLIFATDSRGLGRKPVCRLAHRVSPDYCQLTPAT